MHKQQLFFFLVFLFFIQSDFCTIENQSTWQYVDFETSMNLSSYTLDNLWWPENSTDLLVVLHNQYETNKPSSVQKKSTTRIPKIIHQIWLGSEFPERLKRFQQTWIEYHPDWKYRLWTEEDVKLLNMRFPELYKQETKYSKKSNILRYEILYQFGGVYIDTDVECLKPFDVLHENYDFYAGISQLDEGIVYIGSAIIGAKPGHPIMQHCAYMLKDHCQKRTSMQRTGTLFFTKAVMAKFSRDEHNILLPASYFYPLGYKSREMTPRKIAQLLMQHPESYAIHYWDASWVN